MALAADSRNRKRASCDFTGSVIILAAKLESLLDESEREKWELWDTLIVHVIRGKGGRRAFHIKVSDQKFHNFRASKSADRRI